MTTLIGIKADKGERGIILASDLSATRTEWKSQGDVAYRQQSKHESQKIYVDNNREIAIATAGVFDQYAIDFLSALIDGKIDFKKAIEKGFFNDLVNLNLGRWDGRTPQSEYLTGLLIATRFNNDPKLFTCYPLGRIEEKSWTSIGSGSEYATSFISKKGLLIPGGLELKTGVDLAVKALDEASQDIYTGGLDLTVIKIGEITEYGQKIRDSIAKAREYAIGHLEGLN